MRRPVKKAVSVLCTACVVYGAARCISMAQLKRPDIILEDNTSSVTTAHVIAEETPVFYDGGEFEALININTASERELITLNGIGEKIAQRIIHYREENDGFKSIEDIKKVSGIGESKFQKIKDCICVE